MKRSISLLLFSLSILHYTSAQPLTSRWQYNWGGNFEDHVMKVIPVDCNKFLCAGTSLSVPGCTKSSIYYGMLDMAIFMLDENGNKLWEKSYGGNQDDFLYDIEPVPAGGFIITGWTDSGPSGNKTSGTAGNADVWVIRIDDNGNIIWENTFANPLYELARKIIPTSDGGFFIGGITDQNSSFGEDLITLKLDANGNLLWSRTYDAPGNQRLEDMLQMPNGNFLLAGQSGLSSVNDDQWIICLRPDGTRLWDKTYGTSTTDYLYNVIALNDGNYLLTGVEGGAGTIRKIDAQGNVLWMQSRNPGYFRKAVQAANGDIYVAGQKNVSTGNADFQITQFDASGNYIGEMVYGGTDMDIPFSIAMIDRDIIVAGQTTSTISGNKTVARCGPNSPDGWIIRLSPPIFIHPPIPAAICNTTNFDIHYTASKLYQTGNVFTAQLSAANGSFTTFTNIGSLSSNTSGIISASLPPGLIAGDKYKIRVIASLPADTSSGNCISLLDPSPVFLGNDTTICSNTPLTLSTGAPLPGSRFLWNDGSTGATLTVSSAGNYSCTVQDLCGSTTGSIQISIKQLPIADIGNDRHFCEDSNITLQSSSQPADVSYLWNTGVATPSITVNWAGNYWLHTTNICGTTGDTVSLFMDPKPVTNFNKDTTLCSGSTRTLSAATGYASYLWYDGQGGSNHTVTQPGEYWVKITGNNGCITRDTATIKRMLPLPTGFLPADTSLCSYEDITLRSTISFKEYTWSTGDAYASIPVNKPGLYWLQATDEKGCTGRDSILISTKECPYGFFMPTAFSPNNDGKNEWCRPRLFGKVTKYHFIIFNRWGQKVFDSFDHTRSWDGKINGQPAAAGTYVWSCNYQLENRAVEHKKGTVVLFR
jgi:gliding motility-associated-like protein